MLVGTWAMRGVGLEGWAPVQEGAATPTPGNRTGESRVCPFPYSSSPRRSSRGTLGALASVGSIPVLVHLLYQPRALQFGGLVLDGTEGTAGLEVPG